MANNTYSVKADPHFATKAIHAGLHLDKWYSGPVVTPIITSTTFKQESPGEAEFVYSRSGNPTRTNLENCIAGLENGKHGLCFSSGIAAADTVIHLLSHGDHIICSDDIYGGTSRYLRNVAPCMGLEVSFVDTSNLDNLSPAIKSNTKMVWTESPANPLMTLADLAGIRKILDKHPSILFVVDNTFLTPYLQRPLTFGADIVLHSLTKYINGHCDVIMGAVVVNSDDLYEKLRFLQNSVGAIPSPMDCYLVLRGVKTLQVRMDAHIKNALAVAKFLESHPCVEKVLYPGLPSHPQHHIALKQTSGPGGMMSFYLKGGLTESQKFFKELKIITLAESLGGYKSLVQLPSIMTHKSLPTEHREKIGMTHNLIRLSVGIESVQDIIDDLDNALTATVKNGKK